VEGVWKWIGRAADVVQIGSVGLALILGAFVGAELELRHASAVWIWIAAIGVALLVIAATRRLVRWWRTHFDSVGGDHFYSNKKIRLADLVGHDSIIRNRTLEDCEIHGPMVMMSTGRGVGGFASCTWNGQPNPIFIRSAQPQVGGVVGLEDCVFRRCRFFNVTIMTSPTAKVPEWKEGFGITES
jgi:hypothetical protein